jgi:Rrf2 family iron-sulfur cluster assembly transcriptional regulator
MIHQKTTQNAIAAMSRLAELYGDGAARLASSKEIAESRNLPVPLVGKILTGLSRGGLVIGSPGPGGGYQLAKPPSKISLKDVVVLFEREVGEPCPYGPGWCGNEEPCPLHDSFATLKKNFDDYLVKTTFAAFENCEPKVSTKKRKRS